MMNGSPHYLLFSESGEGPEPGRWRFVLRAGDGSVRLVADDMEPDVRGERLELLTVVRGLEALDEPSRVTLLTPSPYVCEGIRYGLAEWRRNGWCWEAFGQMVPVKHRDLWQRVDRAMRFHRVECRTWRLDPPHGPTPISAPVRHVQKEGRSRSLLGPHKVRRGRLVQLGGVCGRLISAGIRRCRRRVAGIWATLVPCT